MQANILFYSRTITKPIKFIRATIIITIVTHEIIADVGVDLIYLYLMGRSRPQLSRAVVHIQANRPEKYGKGAKIWENMGKGVYMISFPFVNV